MALLAFWLFCSSCYIAHCQLNHWNKTIGTDGEDIWLSTSDFVPVHSQSFGTIRIGRIMSVEFDFVFGGRTNDPNKDQTEMFFRIGYDAVGGTSCDAQNSKYPSLWLSYNTNTLYVSASDATGCSNFYLLSDYGNISVGVSYHIFIAFDDTHLFVGISGGNKSDWTKEWDRSPTSESHLGDEVPIWWMSGKYGPSEYNRANGTFSEVIIKSDLFTFLTPTSEPTSIPTVETTNITIVDVTADPLPSPSLNPTTMTDAIHIPNTTADVIRFGTESSSITLSADTSVESMDSISWIHLLGISVVLIILCLICATISWFTFKSIRYEYSSPGSVNGIAHADRAASASPAPIHIHHLRRHHDHFIVVNGDEPVTPPPHSTSGGAPLIMENALSVIICIAEYGDDPDVSDLEGITENYTNLLSFFKYLNFDVIPNPVTDKNPFYWTENKLATFMMTEVGRALFDGKDSIQYDGLIVCVSCQGLKGIDLRCFRLRHIIT